MSEHENRQFVELAYATFKAGDIPTLLQSLSEDVTWQLTAPDRFETARRWPSPARSA